MDVCMGKWVDGQVRVDGWVMDSVQRRLPTRQPRILTLWPSSSTSCCH